MLHNRKTRTVLANSLPRGGGVCLIIFKHTLFAAVVGSASSILNVLHRNF